MHRWNYDLVKKSNSKLLAFSQNYYFLDKMSERKISSMPELPRIEVVPDKVISVGYNIGLASSITILRERQEWICIQRCFELAAVELVDLHDS